MTTPTPTPANVMRTRRGVPLVDAWGNDLTDPIIRRKITNGAPLLPADDIALALEDPRVRVYGMTAHGIERVHAPRPDCAFYWIGATSTI